MADWTAEINANTTVVKHANLSGNVFGSTKKHFKLFFKVWWKILFQVIECSLWSPWGWQAWVILSPSGVWSDKKLQLEYHRRRPSLWPDQLSMHQTELARFGLRLAAAGSACWDVLWCQSGTRVSQVIPHPPAQGRSAPSQSERLWLHQYTPQLTPKPLSQLTGAAEANLCKPIDLLQERIKLVESEQGED